MSKKSKLTLIIDGNWLLMSRFSVLSSQYNDEDQMCKELQLLMLKSINLVTKTFTDIDNIIFVSDGGSWRNSLDIPNFLYDEKQYEDQSVEYKGQRHLPEGVNWELVFKYYEEFIDILNKNNITTCRSQNIEGDDWCWYWSNKLNNEGINVILWSKDNDLKQLVNTDSNGCFTVWWNKDNGLFKKAVDENEMNWFFNNEYSQNEIILNNIIKKSGKVTNINPHEIVVEKIFMGD